MMVSDDWGVFLYPALKVIFDRHIRDRKDMVSELFNVDTSTHAMEYHQGIGELCMMEEWNGRTSYQDFSKGFKQTYLHKKYDTGIEIEEELLADELFGEIKKKVNKIAGVGHYTRQYHGASVFNNAWNTSFPGPDAVALCSLLHPDKPGSTSYIANTAAYALNADNLELVRTAMMTQWKDDKGNLIVIDPDNLVLLVPPALRKAALVISDSIGEPDITDNNINIWHGSIDVMEWAMLTGSTAWFNTRTHHETDKRAA